MKQPARRAAAEDRIEDRERVAALVAQPEPRHPEHRIRLLGVVDAHRDVGDERRPFGARRLGAAAQAVEGRSNERHHGIVLEVSRCRNEHGLGDVALAVPGDERVALDPRHRRGVADRRVTEVRAAPERAREQVAEDVLRRVVVHADLFEHDVALFAQLGVGEERSQEHVGQNVDRERQMPVDDLRVEQRRLFIGRRVEVAADRVHLFGDRARTAAARPFEQHMLEEVRDATALRRLRRGADVGEDPDRYRTDVWHCFGEHAQAARQHALADHSVVPRSRSR